MELPLSGSVTPEAIIQVLDRISAYRNQDKNSVCELLTVTNKTILLWYNTINDMFSRAGWEDKDSYNKLKKFISQREIQPEAQRCMQLLEYVEQSIENKELKKLQDKLDIEKIRKIITNIESFIETTRTNDTIIYAKIHANQNANNEEIDRFIGNMLTTLEGFSVNLSALVTDLKQKLNCKN